MRRGPLIVVALCVVAVIALWVSPPAGFAACALLIGVLGPWGRSLAERASITGVVVLGVIALAFPRAGSLPVTPESARILVTVVLAALLALQAVPRWRIGIPAPRLADAVIAIGAVASFAMLRMAYVGSNEAQLVSGLYFSGWDNQGHLVPFANTVEAGSTTWTTVDGSTAWNQWYPSLHSVTWALGYLATRAADAIPDRLGLLWPYIDANALTYSLAFAALAWIASDLSSRIGTLTGAGRAAAHRWIPAAAAAIVMAFGILGSPALLPSAGFTNFALAVAVLAVTAYASARSLVAARGIGWFLLPLGALAVIGLWTPLVLGLAIPGIVVLAAIGQRSRMLAAAWAIGSSLLVGGVALLQARAILGTGGDAPSFFEEIGAVGVGMVPFNVGAALAAPVVVVALGLVLWRTGRRPLAAAVTGPVAGIAAFAVVAVAGTDAAGNGRLTSYYVLKVLDAGLIASAPALGAIAVVAATALLARVRTLAGTAAAIVAGTAASLLAVVAYGYVGATGQGLMSGFSPAPGIAAAQERQEATADELVGEGIVGAVRAFDPASGATPLLWDGSSQLANLWVATLTGVLSVDQSRFYGALPEFPYDTRAVGSVDLALRLDPRLRVDILWFRDPSGAALREAFADEPRVTLTRVPLRPSPLCEECSLAP